MIGIKISISDPILKLLNKCNFRSWVRGGFDVTTKSLDNSRDWENFVQIKYKKYMGYLPTKDMQTPTPPSEEANFTEKIRNVLKRNKNHNSVFAIF